MRTVSYIQHRVGAVLKPYADEAGPRCCDVAGFSQIANCVFASAGLLLGHVVVGFGPFQALTDAVLRFRYKRNGRVPASMLMTIHGIIQKSAILQLP